MPQAFSKQALATGFVAALLLIGGGCDTAPATNNVSAVVAPIEGYTAYDQAAQFKFKLQIPKGWEKDETPDEGSLNVAFYSEQAGEEDMYRENVNITAITIPDGEKLTLKELSDESHKALANSVQKLNAKDEGVTTLGGVTAHKFTFTGEISNPEYPAEKQAIKGVEYFVLNNQTAYNFTGTDATPTFNTFLPTAEKIFATVEFK